ncbi:translocation protein [Punctularia strigosozonata HHB-11173 SS5]|uniref:translocation protein n=1 Tax=Punctularia strigosozonata (strain HHB-11173) TaxID=741275 RepID=UPI0004417D07|nr:translocation protein [Punctularia strigosozonata HHB-11173 SS5]EIN08302.1 translocation protein [Punctularia strigosozonata HHB-11173 SS5]
MSTLEQQAKAPQDVRNVVNFLRSSKAGMKIRVGVLNGKRIDYFKGKGAIKALLSPAYAKLKNVPKVTSEQEAAQLLHSIIPFAFFLKVERGQPSGSSASSPKQVQIVQMQQFQLASASSDYYAWFYEGSQWTTYAGGVAMVVVMLAGVMFPLWPASMRLGVWYLSMGVLGLIGLFFVIAILRLVFYIITIIVTPPGIWIFPKLFADVGFVESFIPLWEWDLPKKKGKKKKVDKGKGKAPAEPATGGAKIEEVVDSGEGESRPNSRSATIEDVPDEE